MNKYEKDWAAIDKLEYDDQTQSALKSAQELYDKIVADTKNPNQTAQRIKALLYINKYQAQLEEDGLVKAIYRFQQEADKADFPVKPLLQSMVAEMYEQYLAHYLYKFRDRTTTDESFKQEDIRTWDVQRITNHSYNLYLASISDDKLKTVQIKDFEDILIFTPGTSMPTLYDLLMYRALEFFRSDRKYLTQPAYKFYIEQPEAFEDVSAFIQYQWTTKDSLSSNWHTLRLFQQWLRFHEKDSDKTALLYADLMRLAHVNATAILPNKSDLYFARIQKMAEQYAGSPLQSELNYLIAKHYHTEGSKYVPAAKDDERRWYWRTARELCDKNAKMYPSTYGARNCLALMSEIDSKNMLLEVEKVSPIKQSILAKINYRNVKKVNLKVLRLSEAQWKNYQTLGSEKGLAFLNTLSATQAWSMELPDEKDYRQHSLEFKVPSLEGGFYLLMSSESPDFKYIKNGVSIAPFFVSDIAYMYRQDYNNHNGSQHYEFYVTNRTTGEPLKGAKLEFYMQRYNSLLRAYEYIKEGEATSDSLGFAKAELAPSKDSYYSRSYRVKIKHKSDELYTEDYFYEYKNNSVPYEQPFTQFFLDRAIYRPGQTIYFKGIMLSRLTNGKNPHIVPNMAAEVVFYDVNSQEVARIKVTSNDFGSFQGSFTAPSAGLTGSMRLYCTHGNSYQYFRVEEYKRPKFEVTFNPLEGSFKVEEPVLVKGLAKAYAGNAIDDAKVQYRVVRQTSFPYWRWWMWGWHNPYNQAQQEIIFGESKTNGEGIFEIKFDAIIDKSIPKERQPVFTYTVYADVTDNTGETHSTQTTVRVGMVALDVALDLPKDILREQADTFEIKTRNLNWQFEPAQGNIIVEQLEKPTQVFNTRMWEKPDYFLMAEKDFKTEFPLFAYKDEDLIHNWKVAKKVLDTPFDTKTNKLFAPDYSQWEQGAYKLTLKTQDKFGSPIEIIRYFTIYSQTEKAVPSNTALFLNQTYWSGIEPGETVKIEFGSLKPDAFVLFEIEHDRQIVSRQWLRLNGRQQYNLPIEEKHRGNVHFHISTIQNNRIYNNGGSVMVPWSNKELSIEYETFRDKLLPGQDEEWKIKISGNKKDKVAAEIVAGMYDASLDAFAPNAWGLWLNPTSYRQLYLQGSSNFAKSSANLLAYDWSPRSYGSNHAYTNLNWFGFVFYEHAYYGGINRSSKDGKSSGNYKSKTAAPSPKPSSDIGGEPQAELAEEREETKKEDKPGGKGGKDRESNLDALADSDADGVADFDDRETDKEDEVKIRTNLNETVFFFPQLMTDAEGNVVLKFKMNEALTRWKFMAMAHSRDLRVGTSTRMVVTQKDLMITPNPPRFLRQNDEIFFTAKVANITKEKMEGTASLQLFDAITMRPIDADFSNSASSQPFNVEGERSVGMSWRLKVPAGWTNAVTYRVIAKATNFSDGEENSLPVLSNQMLVTETMPLPIRGSQTKKFEFTRMAEVSKSPTMRQHKLTLEFTPNPAWYAIQSLPYLMEYPYECTEQIFSRFYANSLASSVANAHPKIKKVFDTWRDLQPEALESKLTKNQELKYALIEETPWVLDAQNEAQQKKNVGILFDLNRMADELGRARDKMADRQLANGGFAWFPGGRDSWYITQYIVEGFGHLDVMGVKDIESDATVKRMTGKAVNYIDDELARHYTEMLRWIKEQTKTQKEYEEELAKDHLDYMVIHYLYARSFFLDQKVNNETCKKAVAYYENQAKTYWRNKSLYMKGLLALAIHRKGEDKTTPAQIVTALRENSLNNEEMGMYWKYPSGYFWYELPIETHALMIEVFDEVGNDMKAVDDLKTYLLKAKQTTHWKTTKATAAACYALLRRGDNWLLEDKPIEIKLGKEKLDQSSLQKEAGTGYFKTTWEADKIRPEMANVTVENPNKNVAWGAIYWQYFEDLDKITHFKETPLKINKKLFKEVRTDRGPVLKPIEGEKLIPGDLIKVRIEIFVDRDMEYVHMKDMRASGFEPVNVLSQYKYQGGLGYYESTKDMATHFFMDYLSKGTYVFEYPLRVNHKGDFSNGVTTIQCMYAPEFTAHSEGIRVKVE